MFNDIVRRYRAFLRLPDVARLLATALLSRLPIGSLSLAMLMYVRALSGSFALAGLTVGGYLAASAIVAPALGRIIDRRGPRAVLFATGIVCPTALLSILLADRLALSTGALVGAAAIAGGFAPPITVLTRTMWRYRFDDPNERRTAFALDAVLIEMAFTLGPMLIAGLLAVASPRIAFAAAWCLVTLAVPVFVLSPALKYWRLEPGVERHLLGPLSEPRLLVVFAVTFLVMFALGLLEIAYAGFATAAAMPAFAGVLIAVNSLGSGAGGLVFGGLPLATPIERLLPRLLLLLAVPLAAHALTASP
ncbi:MAG: MFS transporter, partial [Casimicrobiaceae bacterium]